jgi:hypothetical protein
MGLKAKFLFYREILVWVEGEEDLVFFNIILRNKPCRIEIARGKNECLILAQGVIQSNLPYIVIIDGDYEILKRKKSVHRRVIILNRYSIENYLMEESPIERVCINYVRPQAGIKMLEGTYQAIIKKMYDELYDLVLLDAGHYFTNSGLKVMPEKAEIVLENQKTIVFSKERIQEICDRSQLNDDVRKKTKNMIDEHIRNSRFIDLINGHFIFCIIRHLIFNTVRLKKGRNPNIDNDGLLCLLSIETWNAPLLYDHSRLKKRIFRAVRDAQISRKAFPSIIIGTP